MAQGRTPGTRGDPYTAFNFLVRVDEEDVGGFSEVRGLEAEVTTEDYTEGGVNDYVHKLPGPTRHPPVVLKRGLTSNLKLWSWHRKLIRGEVERKQVTIFLLDTQGNVVDWWSLKDAYPVKWVGPQLKADGNAVAVESVELVHRGMW